MKRVFATVLLMAGTGLVGKEPVDRVVPLEVHEWGTFTSVANAAGEAVIWNSRVGAPDLPCFVHRDPFNIKGGLWSLIRMETPVLYFYSDQPQTVSVDVQFPKGRMTEWYPEAKVTAEKDGIGKGSITWNNMRILPGEKLTFPEGNGASHYYTARETDAAPLRVGREQEKLLFYRGVADFNPQVAAGYRYQGDGKLEIWNTSKETVPVAILFENQGMGKVGYRVIHNLADRVSVDPPEMTEDVATLHGALRRELVAAGLYEKEAAAMVETWRDTWFEEGTRVFYIMSSEAVDEVLPLKVEPAPTHVARVFVGRLELLSPWTRKTIEDAHLSNPQSLKKFGRFLDTFASQMNLSNSGGIRPVLNELTKLGVETCVP